jgi:hypothetical protein
MEVAIRTTCIYKFKIYLNIHYGSYEAQTCKINCTSAINYLFTDIFVRVNS